MSEKFQRRYRKALESIVYLSHKDNRVYWVLKSIYYADKFHLERYGQQLFDESYYAMVHGPVPSLAYDIVKCARGVGWYIFDDPKPKDALEVPNNKKIIPKRSPALEFLSASDLECLDDGHEFVKDMSFSRLKRTSHDDAWKAVEQDEEMSLEAIIKTLPNSKEVLDYLES